VQPAETLKDVYYGNASVEDYLKKCARSMIGINLIDPLPTRFVADTAYYEKLICEARQQIKRVDGWTDEEAGARAETDFQKRSKQADRLNKEEGGLIPRYEGMLKEVVALDPTTAAGIGLRILAMGELEKAIKDQEKNRTTFPQPQKESGAEYRARLTSEARKTIQDAEKVIITRTKEEIRRNKILEALRELAY
jgi:hypothetical protein